MEECEVTGPITDWNELPLFLTPNEVAIILRRGRSATYELIRRGEIPNCKLGGKTLALRERLRETLDKLAG